MTPSPFDECPADAEWRPLSRLPGYEVSEFGHLRGPRGLRRAALSTKGYAFYYICQQGDRVYLAAHRGVLEAFVGPPPTPRSQASHLNGVKLDARPSNLRWASAAENYEDGRKGGRAPIGERNGSKLHPESLRRGVTHRCCKLTEGEVRLIRASTESGTVLAARFRVTYGAIDKIRRGERWRHIV